MRIATRVIIYKGGKVLLCKNEKADFWYPGGGGLEDNEDLIECCKREVEEEIGQKAEIIDLMYVQEFFQKNGQKDLCLCFLADLPEYSKLNQFHKDNTEDGRIKVYENRWFSEEEVKSGKFIIFPEFMRDQFWEDVKNFDTKTKRYFKTYES